MTRPQKRLSQNFIKERELASRVVAEAELCKEDVVLEIGPGRGMLTHLLSAQSAHLIAIEKDERMLPHLQLQYPKATLLQQDVLQVNLTQLLTPFLTTSKRAKLVANLPFNVSLAILTHIIPMHTLFSRVTVIVQQEVAQRIVAEPGSLIGSVTHFLRFFADVRYGFIIPPSAFYPEPKVHSAVVTFDLHPPRFEQSEPLFALIRSAFQQRRKMLRVALKQHYSQEQLLKALEACALSVNVRPEELSLEEWIVLRKSLQASVLD